MELLLSISMTAIITKHLSFMAILSSYSTTMLMVKQIISPFTVVTLLSDNVLPEMVRISYLLYECKILNLSNKLTSLCKWCQFCFLDITNNEKSCNFKTEEIYKW